MRTINVCAILIFCCLAIGCTGWAYRVPTESMLPTIKVGETCIINKFEYSSGPIQRFDIVVSNAPDDIKKLSTEKDVKIITRIIGLPNEKIEIKDNKIYINDKLLDEPFEKIIDEKDRGKDFSAITIPENEYFLLGDNRPNSSDSRLWKKPTIEKANILGKVIEIIPAEEK